MSNLNVRVFRWLQEIRRGYFVHENLENSNVNALVNAFTLCRMTRQQDVLGAFAWEIPRAPASAR